MDVLQVFLMYVASRSPLLLSLDSSSVLPILSDPHAFDRFFKRGYRIRRQSMTCREALIRLKYLCCPDKHETSETSFSTRIRIATTKIVEVTTSKPAFKFSSRRTALTKWAFSRLYACPLVIKQSSSQPIFLLSLLDRWSTARVRAKQGWEIKFGHRFDLLVVERGGNSSFANCGNDSWGLMRVHVPVLTNYSHTIWMSHTLSSALQILYCSPLTMVIGSIRQRTTTATLTMRILPTSLFLLLFSQTALALQNTSRDGIYRGHSPQVSLKSFPLPSITYLHKSYSHFSDLVPQRWCWKRWIGKWGTDLRRF